jgi:hypothetical protein
VPEGEVVVRLYDGAIGPTYLAHSQAQASLNAAQQLSFSADLAPAEAGRHSGHVRVSGSIPLRPSQIAPSGLPPFLLLPASFSHVCKPCSSFISMQPCPTLEGKELLLR